ncbi:MAG: fibronectin type III domain-containing protein [Terriglobia bacterium]
MKQLLVHDRLRHGKRASLVVLAAVALAIGLHPAALFAAPTISYVQGNYATPQTAQTTVTIPFTAAQAAGDLNVVVVGWNNTTAAVSSVADKSGNAYMLAVGPTLVTGALSQSIYYAKNIAAAAAGANSVTVTFSKAAAYPDIRILEYSGADPSNPVDVTAASSGSSATSTSGAAITTNPTDLIFGANIVTTTTSGPGSGFAQRLLTAPDGDLAEDHMITAVGSYAATASLGSSGLWIMQMVAFRTPVLTAGSFTLSVSPVAVSVTQGNQGTSTITTTVSGGFNSSIGLSASGVPSGTTVSFNPSTIAAPGTGNSTMTITVGSSTPAGTYPITVTANGGGAQQNATVTMTVTATPNFTLSVSPSSLSVTPGNQGTSTITTSVSGGFSNPISLSASGAPSGATVSFNPSTIAAPGVGNSTLTITVGSSTPVGTYPITVTGNGGGVQQNATVILTVVTASTAITYVQGNYSTPQTAQSTVTIPFTAAQTTGDLNVIVVGWNDTTTTVSTVADKSGNAYALAVGPTIIGGALSQSIYYAKNIAGAAAGANTVTVTFSKAAAYPDIRILEYSGADPNNPVDVTAAGSGSGTTSSSGSATTTNATDLILGANIVTSITSGLGSGFTKRLLTSPDGDIAEDEMATAAGTYSATASLGSSGLWIMQMVAFRTPSSGGILPPTAPGNLTAPAASASQINLSWTASTSSVGIANYLVERCQSAGCINFVQIASPASTTYNDTGLTGATSYSYRVRAVDTANNLSLYSNIATALTPTSGTPTAPANVVAVAGGGPGPTVAAVQSYINSTYLTSHTAAAFDSTGADLIVLCASSHAGVNFTPSDNLGNVWIPIAGPTNTSVGFDLRTEVWYVRNPIVGPGHTVNMGLSFAQPLVMSIFAVKGSNLSSPVDAVSLIGSDNGTSTQSVASPSIIASGISELLMAFAKVSAGAVFQSGPGFTQQPAASSNFLDAETNTEAAPGTYNATFTIDSPQTWQSVVVAAANNPNEANLTWIASTETGGTISSYLVERCQGAGCSNFTQIGTTANTTFNDIGLTPSTSYSYRVRAQDAAGTQGPYSGVVTIATPAPIPSLPGNLTATAASSTQVNLSWIAAAETGGTVSSYLVDRCQGAGCTSFTQIGSSAATTFGDTTATGSTSYSYRVRAMDAASHFSPYSNVASATTSTILDTQPPTAPSGLAAAASTNQINLSWSASTDNVAVTGYLLERCQGIGCTTFAQIATPTGTTYDDSGLTVGTTYSYRVRATDAAGNLSPYSNVAAATTYSTSTTVGYVQGNSATPQTAETAVTVLFTAAQTTGDLNVVVVGWNDTTTTVSTVTDKSGNAYALAVGPTIIGGALSQSIYYAKNIAAAAAGANTVTVTFSKAAAYPDIRILEYSGADPNNPVDVTAAGTGSGATSSSSATTTSPADLIFGANIVTSLTSGPGSGFTERLLTSPDGDIAEDEIATTTGNYSATAPLSSGTWIMQMVAFRTAAGATSTLSISPRATVLTFTQTQQFTTTGGTGTVTWSVDGVIGGSSSSGTITTTGLYTSPNGVGSHIVTAAIGEMQPANATVYVSNYAGTFTYHNDNLRTGQNLNETVLTLADVNQAQFGKLFSYSLDGIGFASPLYVANVSIPGNGYHNVVYVATEHDSVYAFDADGRSSAPLWHVDFLSSGATPVPCGDTGECGDIPTEIGITGTPVIDQASGTMYLIAKTKEGTQYVQRLHAIDIATGAEKFGGPVVLQGSVPGTGDGSSGGKVAFNPLRENQRPGLLLNNGVVYLAFGSHGDNSPYHGWVMGYNATTLQQVMIYNVTPNGSDGGIWQGGGGLAVDADGNIYFSTSNGTFDVNTGGIDYGDSIEKLTLSGSVADYFTPHDQSNMSSNNLDLGAGGPTLLVDQTSGPYPHLLIASGKTGTIYVINRDNMGHYNPNNDNQIVQSLVGALANGGPEEGNYSTPVYFNGYIYFAAVNDTLKAFRLSNGLLSASPTSQSTVIFPCRGGSFAISANGATNGILWAVRNLGDPNNDATIPGVLIAYDATDLTHELYDSSQAGSRDTMDYPAKFAIPLVANGKVFVAGQTQLIVYGLLP